ncbi:hypothetical protein [Methylobacterium brachythecii]|uniref:Uncharacterized protein n=1 Tax=Methylobacterium brachythecii TaxID=1176177 RepID=A0A7W6AJ28_9HYPH|nr:hypothetical protein [Methylobacterium brachythecii]MBB3903386.1 hypothetical protein [Methylobacterium brachythecii]
MTSPGDCHSHGAVYTILTRHPDDAVRAVAAALGMEARQLSLSGSLSRSLARAIGLKPLQVHRI